MLSVFSPVTHSFFKKCGVRVLPLLQDRRGVRSGRAGGGPQEAAGPCEEPDLPTRLLLPVLRVSFGFGRGGGLLLLCVVSFLWVCLFALGQCLTLFSLDLPGLHCAAQTTLIWKFFCFSLPSTRIRALFYH